MNDDAEVVIQITDPKKFYRTVRNVDLSSLNSEGNDVFGGGIYIHTTYDQVFPFYGLIRANDFKSEYGFILKTT
ncbi:hypothetical protein BFP97_06345 [Roseivirga sp. 4D4]|uniref:hypothetical protein n=1 Tax=Roseivirga sp. 4D4 TaxID=1889784 RepID=UPI000852C2E9|nr:hypothetical protein [Roseivirga sp. 4D4]OEK01151.1 hypothetical protein BFP97_06345 [Roseivirga sp. 4D4]